MFFKKINIKPIDKKIKNIHKEIYDEIMNNKKIKLLDTLFDHTIIFFKDLLSKDKYKKIIKQKGIEKIHVDWIKTKIDDELYYRIYFEIVDNFSHLIYVDPMEVLMYVNDDFKKIFDLEFFMKYNGDNILPIEELVEEVENFLEDEFSIAMKNKQHWLKKYM